MSSWEVMAGHFGGWDALEEGWRKGPWTAEEDRLLLDYVRLHGEGRWNSVARLAGLKRNGKSCRLRWVNYLRPDLKREQITPHEKSIILELHARWGNRTRLTRKLLGLLGTLLTILVALLQLRFQSTKASPFDTHRLHFAALFTLIVIFTVLLVIGFKLEADGSDGPATIVSTIYLSIGYLSLTPLLLIIEPYVGWTVLILWFFFFVKWAWESFKEICDSIVYTVEPVTNSLKALFHCNRNQNEEANMSTNV